MTMRTKRFWPGWYKRTLYLPDLASSILNPNIDCIQAGYSAAAAHADKNHTLPGNAWRNVSSGTILRNKHGCCVSSDKRVHPSTSSMCAPRLLMDGGNSSSTNLP